ncbi:MAG TPA: CDP-glucose 4,6-dehydratase, partial [Opitutae bacterium]|nr:CDP-glucose 4,6-dehydratase [Opitutae bacterium]
IWDFERTICETVTWYQKMEKSSTYGSARELTAAQIQAYTEDARQFGLAWAQK